MHFYEVCNLYCYCSRTRGCNSISFLLLSFFIHNTAEHLLEKEGHKVVAVTVCRNFWGEFTGLGIAVVVGSTIGVFATEKMEKIIEC